jgi:hypothetical protein
VNDGAGCPQYKPLGATSNPDTSVLDATENHASVIGITRPNATPLNDPG